MTNQGHLLDQAQRRLGLTSDNQLAQALDWLQPTVSSYRSGRRVMDIEQALDFATKTGIPLTEVVAAAVADKKAGKTATRRKKGQQSLNFATG